ncbi:unnamed protein product [Withania somnifera]
MDMESTWSQGESVTKVSVWDLPDVPQGKLPPHLELKRTRVLCGSLAPTNTENVNYSGAYAAMGVDNSVRFEQFRNNFKVDIVRLEEDELEFDMIGIDPSLANAFRRILIAELPTMAIEKVLIANNTSIIQDEVLAHRLGLIPIKVDPRLFEYMSENDVPNEKNTIVFKLHVRCKKGSERLRVLSSELKWLPNGSELILATESLASNSSTKPKTYTSFSCSQDSRPEFSSDPVAPKDADIIIAKLGPGQVVLLRDIEDDEAEVLVKKCPVKVFDIEDIGKGRKRATVARPRACTLCRECIREEGWDKNVAVRRVNDHFIFTIESTGALPPEVLFTEAVKILEEKCERVITELS